MNQLLKALLDVAFDGLKLTEDSIAKNYFSIFGDMTGLIGDVPSVIANFSDLSNELKSLAGSDQEADLVEYVKEKFKLSGSSAKAQIILAAGLKMVQDLVVVVQDGLDLKAKIQS